MDDALDIRPPFFGVPGASDSPLVDLRGSLSPPRIALGDLDGDGDLDIAATGDEVRKLVVGFQRGDGRFEVRDPPYETGAAPILIEAGDLDADADVDLIALIRAESEASILAFWNDGAGRFPERTETGVPRQTFSFTVADFDLDGDLDLVTLNFEGNQIISLLRNVGHEPFPHARVAAMDGQFTGHIISCDLAGNGAPDLVVMEREYLDIFLNDGTARFASPEKLFNRDQPGPLLAADLDGDLDLDLAVGNVYPENLAVFINEGRGNFAEVSRFPGFPFFPVALIAEDLDGDGDQDLAAASGQDVSVFMNDGRGRFETLRSTPIPEAVGRAYALEAGDLDGDGDPDLLTTTPATIHPLLNRGDAHFGPIEVLELAMSDSRVAAADLDGDGDLDLATASPSSASILENLGPGEFAMTTVDLGSSPNSSFLETGDFDDDGDVDLAFTDSLLRNVGQGTFLPEPYEGFSLSSFAVTDLDGDGDLDLASGETLAFNDGSGRFEPILLLRAGTGMVCAGDIDGDGDADLVTTEEFQVLLALNDGTGRNFATRTIPIGSNPVAASIADLDGDGDPDIVTANRLSFDATNNISILQNVGNGNFAAGRNYATDRGTTGVVCADLDGDGDLDVLTVHEVTTPLLEGSVVSLTNHGDATFSVSGRAVIGRSARHPAAGDLDGDGDTDIAVACRTSLSLLYNQAVPPPSRDTNENGLPDECEDAPFHRGDPSGDGISNIADALFLLHALFLGGKEPGCLDSADADDDGTLQVSDAIFILGFLFLGNFEPPSPGPPGAPCGRDTASPDDLRDLGCKSYEPCA